MSQVASMHIVSIIALAATIAACVGVPSTPDTSDDPDGVGTAESALGPARCYGKMLQPSPLEVQQPIGQPMTLRVNRQCDPGAPLVTRKIRIYARRYEGGVAGAQQLLVDWTDWPGAQYRFDVPWSAGTSLSGSLPPGRYQIYSYTINASLYADWVANDAYARQMSTRSDNTYVEIVEPGTWTSSAWGACSAPCGGGAQSRTNTCVDAASAPLAARMCLGTAPSTSQACNSQACGGSCVGHCNGMSAGCFCDTMCEMAGDCCSDYQAVCAGP